MSWVSTRRLQYFFDEIKKVFYHAGNKPTASDVGAIPIINATSADYDMDALLKLSADYTVYKVGSPTLGTPYKYNKTSLSWGWIINIVSSSDLGFQIAFLSGGQFPLMRFKQSGEISEWSSGFLPLTGGTLNGNTFIRKDSSPMHGLEATNSNSAFYLLHNNNGTQFISRNKIGDGTNQRTLALEDSIGNANIKNAIRLIDTISGTSKYYCVFGEHNKPSGSYTGNGSATQRTITIGGLTNNASACIIHNGYSGETIAIVTKGGAIVKQNTTVSAIKRDEARFENGNLILATTRMELNTNGSGYYYQVV